jgi:hypothetical protein
LIFIWVAREKTTYANREQCIRALSLDPRKVDAAIKLGGADAGLNANYSVNGKKLQIWIDDHPKEIEDYLGTLTLEDVKLENALLDGDKKRLEIAKLRELYINPDEVKAFYDKVLSAQDAVIKKWRRELGPKVQMRPLAECDAIIGQATNELLSIMKGGYEAWQTFLNS